MFLIIFLLGFLGLWVSLYARLVEKRTQKAGYKPFCDISDSVSCSRMMESPYSKLFGISLSLTGIAFYLVIMTLAALNSLTLLQYFSFTALLISVVLAYLMYFKINVICPLCVSLYIINFLIFVLCHV